MNLLVTGGAGFIGSEFISQVSKTDHDVVIVDSLTYAGYRENIDSSEYKFSQTDIRDKDSLSEIFIAENFDYVVNFAAESHVDNSIIGSRIFLETNVQGTLNLLELSQKHGVSKFLQISTDEVYGSLVNGVAGEDSCFKPSSPYAASKAAAEQFLEAFKHTFNLPTLVVRCSNNYGPRQYPEKLIPLMIKKLLDNEKVPIYGNGKNVREWIHVSDCVRGIIRVLEDGQIGEVYNISSGDFRENVQVAQAIIQLLGKDVSMIEYVADRKGHDFRYAIDSSKIRKNLGWEPQINFDSGLSSTLEWYLNNQERFK